MPITQRFPRIRPDAAKIAAGSGTVQVQDVDSRSIYTVDDGNRPSWYGVNETELVYLKSPNNTPYRMHVEQGEVLLSKLPLPDLNVMYGGKFYVAGWRAVNGRVTSYILSNGTVFDYTDIRVLGVNVLNVFGTRDDNLLYLWNGSDWVLTANGELALHTFNARGSNWATATLNQDAVRTNKTPDLFGIPGRTHHRCIPVRVGTEVFIVAQVDDWVVLLRPGEKAGVIIADAPNDDGFFEHDAVFDSMTGMILVAGTRLDERGVELRWVHPAEEANLMPKADIRPPIVKVTEPADNEWPVTTTVAELRCVAGIAADSGPIDELAWILLNTVNEEVESVTNAFPDLDHTFGRKSKLESGDYYVVLKARGQGGEHRTRLERLWKIRVPPPPPPKPPVPERTWEALFQWQEDFFDHHFPEGLKPAPDGTTEDELAPSDGIWLARHVMDQDLGGWRVVDEEYNQLAGNGLFFDYADVPPPPPPPTDPRYGTIDVMVVHPAPGVQTDSQVNGLFPYWGPKYIAAGFDGVRQNIYLRRSWPNIQAQLDAAYAKAGAKHVWILDTSPTGFGLPEWTDADTAQARAVVDHIRQLTGGIVRVEVGNEVWDGAHFDNILKAKDALLPGRGWLHIGVSADPFDWNDGEARTIPLSALRDLFNDDSRLHPVFHFYTGDTPRRSFMTINEVMAQFYPDAKGRPWMTEGGWERKVAKRHEFYPDLIRVAAEGDCELVCLFAYIGTSGLWLDDGSETVALFMVTSFLNDVRVKEAKPLGKVTHGDLLTALVVDERELDV